MKEKTVGTEKEVILLENVSGCFGEVTLQALSTLNASES